MWSVDIDQSNWRIQDLEEQVDDLGAQDRQPCVDTPKTFSVLRDPLAASLSQTLKPKKRIFIIVFDCLHHCSNQGEHIPKSWMLCNN